jgi:hypothetical protein
MLKVTEEDFIQTCRNLNSTTKVAGALGLTERTVRRRRQRIFNKKGVWLDLDNRDFTLKITVPESQTRTNVALPDGCVMVASDAHYFPRENPTAHRAFVYLIKELKPEVVIMNGDSFDGSSVSRFPRIGWDKNPTLKDEIDTVQLKLEEIRQASLNTKHLHTWGNHDFRFNTYLSNNADQFEGIQGFRFEDHFPGWNFSMSVMINDNLMIKHRYHGGIHATWNNVLKSGVSMVTGHLHSLQVRPFTDYNGTRYAVDTGTLACPTGEQFKYAEDNPKNQRSGFAVLVIVDGKLMPPETCEVIDEEEGLCFFRGQQFKA